MPVNPLAGQPARPEMLVNIPRLVTAYYTLHPDPEVPEQRVAFGTSGHRGSSLDASFNEDHVLAISQAICDYRKTQDYTGPLYLGMDTHALSEPAHATAVEVFAANDVDLCIQINQGYTPTPAVSHAILSVNRGRRACLADGVVITPSHNPPEDGGFKYNPPSGGPADTSVTRVIQDRANQLLKDGLRGVRRMDYAKALQADNTHPFDFIKPYVKTLASALNLQAISEAGVKIGADPLGGASLPYWAPIVEMYHLNLEVVNPILDPTFRFMPVDHDGKIRMDCSSPYAMAGLIALKDRFDIAFANDPDSDRHGIVTRGSGLMNPNHYLAVAIHYLFQHRPGWSAQAAVGKTLVSSAIIDRVAAQLGRRLVEVPVGFKYFVDGLLDGSLGFGGEESAGASFLRMDGSAWTTDKDGILLNLLAAEITAVTGKDPAEHYQQLEDQLGRSVYTRLDVPATPEQKEVLSRLSPEMVEASELAGQPVLQRLTRAPGNNEPIGGLKVTTKDGWFAARPSGTENIYKIYAESFIGDDHLQQIVSEAKGIVAMALANAGAGG